MLNSGGKVWWEVYVHRPRVVSPQNYLALQEENSNYTAEKSDNTVIGDQNNITNKGQMDTMCY